MEKFYNINRRIKYKYSGLVKIVKKRLSKDYSDNFSLIILSKII